MSLTHVVCDRLPDESHRYNEHKEGKTRQAGKSQAEDEGGIGMHPKGGQKDEGEAFTGDTARQEQRMGHVERTQGPNQKPV